MPEFEKSTGYVSPIKKLIRSTGVSPFKMKKSPFKVAPIVAFLAKAAAGAALGKMAQKQGGKGGYDHGPKQNIKF